MIINKFGPGSNAITGTSATDLADHLADGQTDIEFLCIDALYKSKGTQTNSKPGYKTTYLKNSYSGNNSTLRMLFSLYDGWRLFRKALKSKSDVFIVMTDPPLLIFWFQIFRKKYKAKLVYWTMDIFPEAFVAGNFSGSRNPVFLFLQKTIYKYTPDLIIALGKQQLNFLESKFRSKLNAAIIPCGIVNYKEIENSNSKNGALTIAYCGNIGAAHDSEFLVELISQLKDDRFKIILSLYGAKAEFVKQQLRGQDNIEFKTFVSQDELRNIDINIASLLPQWNHLCVPSKAVTAICCGNALLMNASEETDTFNMFKNAGWNIRPGTAYNDSIRKILDEVSIESVEEKKRAAYHLAMDCQKILLEGYGKVKSQILSW